MLHLKDEFARGRRGNECVKPEMRILGAFQILKLSRSAQRVGDEAKEPATS